MGQVTIRFITNCESFCSTTLFWYKKSKNKNADFINKNIRRCRGNSAGISRWLKFNSWLLGGVLSSLFEPFERGESWAWRRVPIATKSLGVENATHMCLVSTGTKIQISYENEWERVWGSGRSGLLLLSDGGASFFTQGASLQPFFSRFSFRGIVKWVQDMQKS